ncbi:MULTISPECIES: phosphotransferase family protein [Streptomyces]|uniref:Aminoglycoside phosphotransferase family protein n=2 Tax=Streptomyces TaxID=1883 RepID=A0ABS9JAH0_9ACTN|nr:MULTISPECIES: phosphotransferase [Streptomyces]MCG0062558.1 aminoglycoside phosphotransferase family protein [Streptomyces tricolor]MYU29799.1 phosphotransferase [Streptomyces sp. SID7810]OYP15584.1 aminoglycoside phosphotransferase [Streptomyces sp. FBKL.4005]CUW30857.1 Phosphotransferase enzyme family protein [Streptomyces reticuli]
MTPARTHLTRDDLAPLARAALGRTPTAVTRLRGGSRKGVYRLALDDGTTAIAYVWSPDEDYWRRPDTDLRDTFSHASGIGLFLAAHHRLTELGVRVPRLLFADREAVHLPAYAAVVEDIPGANLERLLRDDPAAARVPLARLAGVLGVLREHTAAGHGKAVLVEEGGTASGGSCAQVAADRAVRDIADAAERDPRVRAVRAELTRRVRDLQDVVAPRGHTSLVHGELGPDHVLVTPDGDPALIDIEGLMYFDAEWEHVFLQLRFGPAYDVLRAPGLDPDRLALYRLAMHLGLVAGPLRLLDGDFPERAAMREIAEFNLRRALALLPAAS